jgi:uncharacterized protein YceK
MKRLLVALFCLAMTGCASVMPFVAANENERTHTSVHVKWLIKPDANAYCRSLKAVEETRELEACAIWSKVNNWCVIVTNRIVTFASLGHEVRHCFEGHFHP